MMEDSESLDASSTPDDDTDETRTDTSSRGVEATESSDVVDEAAGKVTGSEDDPGPVDDDTDGATDGRAERRRLRTRRKRRLMLAMTVLSVPLILIAGLYRSPYVYADSRPSGFDMSPPGLWMGPEVVYTHRVAYRPSYAASAWAIITTGFNISPTLTPYGASIWTLTAPIRLPSTLTSDISPYVVIEVDGVDMAPFVMTKTRERENLTWTFDSPLVSGEHHTVLIRIFDLRHPAGNGLHLVIGHRDWRDGFDSDPMTVHIQDGGIGMTNHLSDKRAGIHIVMHESLTEPSIIDRLVAGALERAGLDGGVVGA